MPETFLHSSPLFLTFFVIFSATWSIQLLVYWVVFLRVNTKARPRNDTAEQRPDDALPAVSVVICAHNECHNLTVTLPEILSQEYPLYEVIVVNHASDDDTGVLLTDLSIRYPHLKVVNLARDLNFFSGKKFPLSLGIRSARYDVVLLTDADCKPAGKQWIAGMAGALTGNTEVVLGYGAYEKRRGLLNALIRFDTLQVAIQYLSFALAGMPYMGVGRNLLYRKSLFFEQKGFISHYQIRSGDDDLFINRVANRKNTAVMVTPETFTWSRPKASFGQWLYQKKRHLTTGRYYRPLHKLVLGGWGLNQLIFWGAFITLLSVSGAWSVVLGMLLLKYISQYVVFGTGMKRLQGADLIPWILLLEWGLMLINLGILVSNLIHKPVRWK